MPDSTRKKILDAALKALVTTADSVWWVKGPARFIAELSPKFGNLPEAQRKALTEATDEELADAIRQIPLATYNAALAAAGTHRIEDFLEKLRATIDEVLHRAEPTPDAPHTPRWPEPYIKPLANKPADHFVGRSTELRQFRAAVKGKVPVTVVIGLAGQGKSSLLAEWYERGAARPDGVGLFWCRAYEAKYTFARFLEDLHRYLTGHALDRRELPHPHLQVERVLGLLRPQPCWVIVDGAERWLKRWGTDPDAEATDLTDDDRRGAEPALDDFLDDAAGWRDGARLLLTTRALPLPLLTRPHVAVGTSKAHDKTLEGLTPDDAVKLLGKVGIHGDEDEMRGAARAYRGHPAALQFLAHALTGPEYGGDIANWTQVDPLGGDLDNVLAKLLTHFPDGRPFLDLIACSLVSLPVSLLADATQTDRQFVQDRLSALARWQFVELTPGEAGMHAVVRRHLIKQLGHDGRKRLAKQLAEWWAARPISPRPQRLDQLQPRLTAVEHAIDAGQADLSRNLFYRKIHAEDYFTPEDWLGHFGFLAENVRLNARMIGLLSALIQEEGRTDLRNDLAMAYNNRGNARQRQGDLGGAIADYDEAIRTCALLVEEEGQTDLRNDLASAYNNRGVARRQQGDLSGALADYEEAIRIRRIPTQEEGRTNLRNALADVYNNRGIVREQQGDLDDAIGDYDKAISISTILVGEESRTDLRNDLASAYNNRGGARDLQGDLGGALADFDEAIRTYRLLVEEEGRTDLRNDLADVCNNRGIAREQQGDPAGALADFDEAIRTYRLLVEEEGRTDLRNDLAGVYNNRGIAREQQGDLKGALADDDEAVKIRRILVEDEGLTHLARDLVDTLQNRAIDLHQANRPEDAARDRQEIAALRAKYNLPDN